MANTAGPVARSNQLCCYGHHRRPFHLVGFGNGGNIATYFAAKHGSQRAVYSLRSLVLLNSFAYIDTQLAAILHSTEASGTL